MKPFVGRGLAEHFASLEDPRVERTKLHPLQSIVMIALCGVIAGAESWNDVREFGVALEDFFADFLDLPNGVPSHDTFNRVFAAIDPKQFRECFPSSLSERKLRCGKRPTRARLWAAN